MVSDAGEKRQERFRRITSDDGDSSILVGQEERKILGPMQSTY